MAIRNRGDELEQLRLRNARLVCFFEALFNFKYTELFFLTTNNDILSNLS